MEPIRRSENKTRFYQVSRSEMFGDTPGSQNETTPLRPRNRCACAKVYSYWMVVNYRAGYDVFASNGILFNHESPRRGETFVTRKITRAIAAILARQQDHLYLGNLEANRDWGYAPEYVETMWIILQQEEPDDFVVGTGETHSVKEFVQEAFSYVGLEWEKYVKIDPRYFRPTEVKVLVADPTRAKERLNWSSKVTFSDLVKIMVDADIRKMDLEPVGAGDEILREKFPDRWWTVD